MLHEKRRERGEREVAHRIGRVFAPPPVGQGLAVTAQRGDEAIRNGHEMLESGFRSGGNPEIETACRLLMRCDICDSLGKQNPTRPSVSRKEIGQILAES